MANNHPQWSDDEALLLKHAALIEEIMQQRNAQERQEEKKNLPKSRWQLFLESSGGTALITVLIGGMFGQFISCSIQQGLKEREFQQTWLKARGDQALETYKDYLNQEQAVMKNAYEIVGNCISASDNLILSTGEDFAPENVTGVDSRKMREDILKFQGNYNKLIEQWRNQREQLGLLISYYHPRQPDVTQAWDRVRESVIRYSSCASDKYKARFIQNSRPNNRQEIEEACSAKKGDLKKELAVLTQRLEEARKYAWEGWESPEKMKAALEK
jgi:hypothetical protein